MESETVEIEAVGLDASAELVDVVEVVAEEDQTEFDDEIEIVLEPSPVRPARSTGTSSTPTPATRTR